MTSSCCFSNLTMSQDDSLVFNFVLKDAGISEVMLLAYEEIRRRKLTCKQISNNECLNIPKAKLKEDNQVYVFDDFDEKNEAFKYVYNAITVYILGSRCVLTLLVEGIQLPLGIYHVHNLAMRNMVVSTTGMARPKKKEIAKFVNFMGANYMDKLTATTTHLVSETVRSDKYVHAATNSLKIMHPDWVNNVWQKSCKTNDNVNAADEQFDRYKLPFFFGLCITSTGLKQDEKNAIKTLVEENGGRYSAPYNRTIDLLIMEENSIGSAKFKEALKHKKICLSPLWIYDSVDKAYALAFDNYIINELETPRVKASTPTKHNVSKFNPDHTQLSDISRITTLGRDITLNETEMSASTQAEYKKILASLTLTKAKKVGNVLDGFNVYLSGFTLAEVQQVGKILSFLGATRIDNVNDQVTHVLVGAGDPKLFTELNDLNLEPVVLRLEWLSKVIESKQIPDEAEFEIEKPAKKTLATEKPSPASKRAINLLNETFKKPAPAIPKFSWCSERAEEVADQMKLINHYSEPVTENTENVSVVKILAGKYVHVYGFADPLCSANAIEDCEQLGATLVDNTFNKEVDYVVTPSSLLTELKPAVKMYKNIVNDFWLEDSVEARECVEIRFIHRPVVKLKDNEKVLLGENFVVSNYKGKEREYIEQLVANLGGIYAEVLKRSDLSIIISPNSEGAKCASAIKWGYAVLPVEWLWQCMNRKERINETPYLIGGSKASSKNLLRRDSIVLSSQDNYNKTINKDFDPDDPPIENFAEDELTNIPATTDTETPKRLKRHSPVDQSPMTPNTPNLSISRLTSHMSTPRRKLVEATLREHQSKNAVSPRKMCLNKLINTPASKAQINLDESPALKRPELPDCMKPAKVNYSIRPDASPENQQFHKRKIEALDELYLSRSAQKKKRVELTPTPPPGQRRYAFFKARIPNYSSPDPSAFVPNELTSGNDAAKVLEFDDDDDIENEVEAPHPQTETDETLGEFCRLVKQSSSENEKRAVQLQDSELWPTSNANQRTAFESENLVMWKDHRNATEKFPVVPNNENDVVYTIGSESEVPRYYFALNALSDQEKEMMSVRINQLGGIVQNENFTHLIVGGLNRCEKFLIAVASGRFALHPAYITKCEREGRFVAEDEYEWGNPKFLPELLGKVKANDVLFKAPYKWRQWLIKHADQYPRGAFTGMKFIVASSKAKSRTIVSIIEAGGGKHVPVDALNSRLDAEFLNKEQVNYCLTEHNFISRENSDFLTKRKVEVLNINFINQHLIQSTQLPSLKQFVSS